MNLDVNLGEDINGVNITSDLKKENIHFIILVGSTGSGKSVFHYYLYHQLIKQNSPSELGFIFYDTTRVDFAGWKSPYLIDYEPDADVALEKFERLANNPSDRCVFVHIEEMEMLRAGAERFEKALAKNLKENRNLFIVFSTSRPGPDIITPKIKKLTDLMLVFNLTSREDSEYVLGESFTENFSDPGERVAVFKHKRNRLKPFSAKEAEASQDYFYPKN